MGQQGLVVQAFNPSIQEDESGAELREFESVESGDVAQQSTCLACMRPKLQLCTDKTKR